MHSIGCKNCAEQAFDWSNFCSINRVDSTICEINESFSAVLISFFDLSRPFKALRAACCQYLATHTLSARLRTSDEWRWTFSSSFWPYIQFSLGRCSRGRFDDLSNRANNKVRICDSFTRLLFEAIMTISVLSLRSNRQRTKYKLCWRDIVKCVKICWGWLNIWQMSSVTCLFARRLKWSKLIQQRSWNKD